MSSRNSVGSLINGESRFSGKTCRFVVCFVVVGFVVVGIVVVGLVTVDPWRWRLNGFLTNLRVFE
jgi:hypothetical protein